jgi:metal-responsive CopG/Arc/MetJ family transcriptional regulator
MKPIVSLTFPKEILDKIDESRGDISRSRYVLRLIQKAYDVQVKEVEN